jgi:two-component system, NarL family, sensor histidine kinase UhpB
MQANSTTARAKVARLTSGEHGGGQPAGADAERHAGDEAAPRGVGRRLLRVPLFYKILIANAAILTLVIVACGVAAHATTTGTAPTFLALLGGGLAVSIGSNALILRLALSPLRRLERTAQSVQDGDLTARAEPSDLADRDLARLMTTFNMMLDSGATYRRRLRDIAARALNATEDERKRIARELHDGIAQTMAALRVQLRVARSVEDATTRDALLEKIGAGLGDATEEVRRIAQGLRPPALDMLGLAPAIESCARSIEENTGLQFDTVLSPVEGLLAPEAELALYRIVQEALSNVARHAEAGTVRIRLSYSGRFVTATVEDDGSGFAVGDEMAGGGGLGLYGMQERAAYVGGTVDIDSEPGIGTRVRAIIPVVETARYV